ncbi:hypothetical protein ACK8HX_09190 [Oryzobacter sp. R7]|uniref:hypothetical protein n=1 Tax=Oryzobacter faecalis TaxID=3388656 RepID=UPI00398D0AE8
MSEQHTVDTAGAGRPVPAASSADPARPDVLPEDARRELDRLRARWAQLPLDRAEPAAPRVRALVVDLASRTAGTAVPDLGPGPLVDQLAVVAWDACAAGRGDGITQALTELRRALP